MIEAGVGPYIIVLTGAASQPPVPASAPCAPSHVRRCSAAVEASDRRDEDRDEFGNANACRMAKMLHGTIANVCRVDQLGGVQQRLEDLGRGKVPHQPRVGPSSGSPGNAGSAPVQAAGAIKAEHRIVPTVQEADCSCADRTRSYPCQRIHRWPGCPSNTCCRPARKIEDRRFRY